MEKINFIDYSNYVKPVKYSSYLINGLEPYLQIIKKAQTMCPSNVKYS
jgi:hypothetical protein